MASRRLRLKAVINLPQRRGKEQESTVIDANVTASPSIPPSESIANEDSGKSDCQDIKRKVDNSTINVESSPELGTKRATSDSNDISDTDPRGNVRKRLKPTVNLPAAVTRKPKQVRFSEEVVVVEEPKISGENEAEGNGSRMEGIDGIERLTEGNVKNPALQSNEEFVIPTSKNIPPKSVPKNLTPPGFSSFSNLKTGIVTKPTGKNLPRSRPSPHLLVNTTVRNRSHLVAGDSVATLPSAIEPRDTLALHDSDMAQNFPQARVVDSVSTATLLHPSSPSSTSALATPSPHRDEPHELELAPTSKTEKRTTHRRLRKNGAGEMLTKARRDFHIKFGNKTPDKKQLTMFDLIFYNPSTNPMKPMEISLPDKERSQKKAEEISERLAEESVDDVNATGSDEELNTAMPAPQVKVGPDGSLIIDEKSLVIETTGAQKRRYDLANSAVVMDYGVGNSTTYSSFTNRVKSKEWTKPETLKFYRALNSVGTDFLLMQSIFPKRTRKDLKQKFKKEDRLNRDLIDKALKYPAEFDIAQLEKDLAQEEKENEEKRQRELLLRKEKEGNTPKRTIGRRGHKPKAIKSFLAKGLDSADIGPVHPIKSSSKGKEALKSEVFADGSKAPPQISVKRPRKQRQRIKKESFSSSSSSSSCSSSSSDEECLYSDAELQYQPAGEEQEKCEVTVEAQSGVAVEEQSGVALEDREKPPPPPAIRTLSAADDVDFSSSDDESVFLKTTRQTRYGRIPQRRILSSESESEEEMEDPPQPSEIPVGSPDLSKVEPGSIVIFASPGHSNYQLFMVGPREPGTDKSKMTPIGVTLTPEVLATMTAGIQVVGERIVAKEPVAEATVTSNDLNKG